MTNASSLVLELQGIISELQALKVKLHDVGVEDLQPLNVVILLLKQAHEKYEMGYVDENEQQGIFN
jgi:hypothetical protein